jgi:L-2-hydroxyglutarate oxidase LhgO
MRPKKRETALRRPSRIPVICAAVTDTVDTVVIGAGVVGLAIARALAVDGREVVLLEKNGAIGEETSARNSEVIHAGLYYPAGSLKARFCTDGARRLYEYCEQRGVPHRRCGKLIVAVHAAQRPKLEALHAAAAANGVRLAWRSAEEMRALEPEVVAAAALWSAGTGIVDSHALMLALRGDLENAGGVVALRSRCIDGARSGPALELGIDTDGERFALRAANVVNAAGLHAWQVARALGAPPATVPAARYAKGNYFTLAGRSPFTHLVYPLPEDGGLGVHATLDLAGRVRFGPDVEWLAPGTEPAAIDYRVDAARAASFERAVRGWWPALPSGALQPAYSGVRPKLTGPGEPAADFAMTDLGGDGAPRVVHLFGIESPGLTSSLAIGEHVRALLGGTR